MQIAGFLMQRVMCFQQMITTITVQEFAKKEQCHKKTGFMQKVAKKTLPKLALKQRHRAVSVTVFTTKIVQSHFLFHLKFQASSLFLRLCRPICVRPGRKPYRPGFSHRIQVLFSSIQPKAFFFWTWLMKFLWF